MASEALDICTEGLYSSYTYDYFMDSQINLLRYLNQPNHSSSDSSVSPLVDGAKKWFWNENEIRILKQNYGKVSTKKLKIKLHRSINSIWKKARELKLNFKHYSPIELDEETNQILLGSLFGDGSLRTNRRNAHYMEVHSEKQKDYLNWKSKYLQKFGIKSLQNYSHLDKRTSKIYYGYYLRTKAHPLLTTYLNKFYRGGKKFLNKEVLYSLSELGLCVLFMDDGNYNKRDKTITLHTENFTLIENGYIIQYFKDKWDIYSKIHKHKNHFVVSFNKENTRRFIDLIKTFTPDCMKYKLGGIDG